MEAKLGMGAGGSLALLCTTGEGLPSQHALGQLLRGINQQLEENVHSLERCMEDVLKLGQDLPVPQEITSPREVADFMVHSGTLDRSRCDSPEPQDTTDLLLKIKEALDQHPGHEDALFNNLMKISSQQGLCLPLPLVSSGHVTSSTVSLNAIPDEDDQGNVVLWSEISARFRRHFLRKIEELPATGNSRKKRLEYLQNSLVFSTAREVWRKYRALRNRQWTEVLKKEDHDCGADSFGNVSRSVTSLERAQPQIMSMMAEDCTLLNCGIFEGTVKAPKAIRDMYLTGLCGWLSGVVEEINTRKKSPEDRKEGRKNGRQKDKALKSAMKMSSSREAFAEEAEEDMTSPEDPGSSSLSRGDVELLCRAVSVFLSLEAHVESLVSTMWDPSHREGRDGQAPLRGVLKNSHSTSNISQLVTDSDSTEADSAPRETADSETVNMPIWQWRATLLELVPDVVGSLTAMVNAALKAGEEEEELYTQNRTLPTEELCAGLYGGELDYPRQVSQCCAVLSRCLQQLLPLAVASSEGGTEQIRTAFVEKTSAACDQVVTMLTKVAADCPHQAPIQNMYICLASAAFIRNQVFHFNSLLANKGERGPLHPAYQSVRDFADSLSQQVIGYHANVIATSVLQDTDSHNWQDPRAFYEGERCSFAVQMWGYHLSALRQDLWVYAPPRLGQHVLACVLRDSLAVLAARYSQARPSYNRTAQFRSDITAVLLITCSFLWSVCDSLHCLLDTTNPPSHPVSAIHNHCTTLTAALTVVSAPLADLYKAFKKGFHKKRRRGEEGEGTGRQNTQWLHFLYPGLFGQLGSFHDLTVKQAAYVQLKLLCGQPAPDWAMLLHLLMMGNCQAPLLLLTQTGLKETVHTADKPPFPATVCEKLHCQQDSCVQPGTAEGRTVLQAVVEVILCCPQYPTVLSKVLLPVIDRLEGWEFFEVSMFAERLEKMPLWCKCLVDAVQPIIKSVVMCAVDYVTEHLGKPAPPNMAAALSALPCGCRATDGDDSDGEEGKTMSTKVVLTRALACLLSALMETVQTIPTAVQHFCKQLQDKLTEREIQTAHSSVGLQLLAGAVYLALHNQRQPEEWAGHSMKQTIKDNLSLLGLCAYHVLTATVASSKGNMPRLAYTFMRKHGSWLTEQIDNIVESVSNVSVDEGSNAAVLEGGNLEFLQLFMSTLAHNILQKQQGKNNLVHLFNVIKANQQWFQVQLGIPPLLGKDDLPQVVPFEPNPGSGEQVMTFDPLLEFNSIGDCNIDQNTLLEFPWEWAELLQSDLGLSEPGFTTLLQHRCDITDESCLDTDKEKRHVATLKAKFGLEQASSV